MEYRLHVSDFKREGVGGIMRSVIKSYLKRAGGLSKKRAEKNEGEFWHAYDGNKEVGYRLCVGRDTISDETRLC